MSTSYSVTPVCDPLTFPFVVCPFVVLAYSFIFSTRISLFIKKLRLLLLLLSLNLTQLTF